MAYPNLAAELTRHGITQERAAAVVGKTPETFSRWMTGKNGMPVDVAFALRDALFPTRSIDYLFAAEPDDGRGA